MEIDLTAPQTPLQDPKVCTKCSVSKERTPSEFHRSSERRDGLYPICKQCVSAYQKQRYADFSPEERERFLGQVSTWRKSPDGKVYQDRVNEA